jgi:hypothetical protein
MKKISSISICLILLFTSCKKEDKCEPAKTTSPGEIVQCFNDTPHDSTTVANAFIGNWDQESISCMVNSDKKNSVVLKINADGSYKMTVNTTTTEGVWSVSMIDNTIIQNPNPPNSFEVKLIRPNGYYDEGGMVSFCGNNMAITPILSDGCYSVYARTK